MKEMVYTPRRQKAEILYESELNGFEYFIVSFGTHPCCYIKIPEEHELFGLDYDKIYELDYDIPCHGGLTYSDDRLLDKEKGWYLGWDYAHLGDYSPMLEPDGRKYSVSVLIAEVVEVICHL